VQAWIELGANLHLRALLELSRHGAEAAKEASERGRRLNPDDPDLGRLLRDVEDTLKIRVRFRLPLKR